MCRNALALLLMGCLIVACENEPQPDLDVPHGFVSTLQIERDGQRYTFGPFVGYYFKPVEDGDLSRVQFICFNERRYYASDMPLNARLYTGEGVLIELPPHPDAIPKEGGRIRPVFFDQAPQAWLDGRPQPHDAYLHFHSLHNEGGAARSGYWLKHHAEDSFTYDMGGRVGKDSPMYHRVKPGVDRSFARIIEFDFGPQLRK